jgi:SWI/SNF-related matrix-associated actin-dependent regulator 1 of chromatin subfamily A
MYQGASNCEELHALMKSTIMIRRLKKEVLSELPLKRRQQVLPHLYLDCYFTALQLPL